MQKWEVRVGKTNEDLGSGKRMDSDPDICKCA